MFFSSFSLFLCDFKRFCSFSMHPRWISELFSPPRMRLDMLSEKADAKRKEALRQRQLAQRLGVEEVQ